MSLADRVAALEQRQITVGDLPVVPLKSKLDQLAGQDDESTRPTPGFSLGAVIDHQAGPLPLTATFETNGGNVGLWVWGSGYRGTAGIGTINASLDGHLRGHCDVYFNNANVHQVLVPQLLLLGPVEAGVHTLDLAATGALLSDSNDFFGAYALEWR